MNGMTNQMVRAAHDALELAVAGSTIRVLVLTGEGKAFCPGSLSAERQGFAAARPSTLATRPARIATLLEKSPTALLGLKQNYLAAERMTFSDFVDYEAERHLKIAVSADTAEAFRAFVEKRKPHFGGAQG